MKSLTIVFFIFVSSIFAQNENKIFTFDLGADAVSRYISRGTEFGNSPQIQPYGSFEINSSFGNFSLGAWASYGLNSDFNEQDFFVEYSYSTEFGEFSLSTVDYVYPYTGAEISNFKGKGEGAHTIETGFTYSGPESFPISFFVSQNIHNDFEDDNSLYIESSFRQTLGEIELNYFIGAANGKSIWYEIEDDGMKITNVGISAEKKVKITESFSLPVGFSLITNPYKKTSYIVFKLSL